jgi:hypothetical protein
MAPATPTAPPRTPHRGRLLRGGTAVAAFVVLSFVSAAGATTPKALPPQLHVGRYVAMGNSYTSGDAAYNAKGAANYVRGTNVPHVDECHRSMNAYPILVATNSKIGATSFVFSACAEARVANFVKTFPQYGNWHEGPQLNAIAPANKPDPKTGLVTLTVGGTDVGLYPDIAACIRPAGTSSTTCVHGVENRLTAGLNLLTNGGRVQFNLLAPNNWTLCPSCNPNAPNVVNVPSLVQLFKMIQGRAPNATILVVGYPELVPADISTCLVGTFTRSDGKTIHYVLDRNAMIVLTSVIVQLNQTIRNQINAAASAGVKVAYVSTFSAFRGHGPCDTTPPNARYLNVLSWNGTSPSDVASGSFHPNGAGQARFSQLVLAQLVS